jgi:hypothetical protein
MYKFGTDGIENTVSKFICYCMCIRCLGNMFTETEFLNKNSSNLWIYILFVEFLNFL